MQRPKQDGHEGHTENTHKPELQANGLRFSSLSRVHSIIKNFKGTLVGKAQFEILIVPKPWKNTSVPQNFILNPNI